MRFEKHQMAAQTIRANIIIIPNHTGQYIGKLIAEYKAYVRSGALDGSSDLSRFKLANETPRPCLPQILNFLKM